MSDKRDVASFLPYRVADEEILFYLQKREPTRRILPNLFTMFGGGIDDGETPEVGCRREIKEELNYEPRQLRYFSRYEAADAVVHVFFEEIGEDFESMVTVLEGEYGKFIPRKEITGMRDVALLTRLAAVQVAHYLEGKKH